MTQAEWFNKLAVLPSQETYEKIIRPNQSLGIGVIAIALLDLILALLPTSDWTQILEVPISLGLTISVSWLASKLFKQVFDSYILEAAVRSGRKFSSELLILVKLLVNLAIIVIAVILFAQTHQINILGLIASLGIGGLAVAFAAQKILEQILGGIVLYLDRPFVVDDYIGLPDGTFGRVESIGLRSTKIRTSGKGTLVIVPNSSLTQVNIENYTGAKKIMSILNLIFEYEIESEELALIRKVILDSTKDIFGIDSRNTEVNFTTLFKATQKAKTQAQVTFFILGSGDVSMELRRQLLDLATQNIAHRLEEQGIQFDIEEPTLYIDAPITV
jgi:MscS family membrane protein